MSIKLSIIIPVYNSEKTLNKCLNSVIEQSLKNIEIICVNDGSSDNSLNILKAYEKTDERIKVLSQENRGQSNARNNGMKMANGEYIGFVDSDDWVDTNMFEKLYKTAKNFDSDISMCSFNVLNLQTGKVNGSDPYMTLDLFPESFENKSFSFKETYDFIFRICVSPCNKIYRKTFIDSIGAKFPEGIFFEDNVFFYETFMQSEKISLIKENLYIYTVQSGVSTVSGADYKKLDFFKVFDKIESFLKAKGYYKDLEDYFEMHKKNTFLYWLKKIKDEDVKKIYISKFESVYGKIDSEGVN